MNPRSFPNGRTAYGEEEREAINMSLDSPDSPEEAEANARSPSLDPDYEPNDEAEMILDKAEAEEGPGKEQAPGASIWQLGGVGSKLSLQRPANAREEVESRERGMDLHLQALQTVPR